VRALVTGEPLRPSALAVTVPRIGKRDDRVEGLRVLAVGGSHDGRGGKESADHEIEFTSVEA